MNRSIAVGDARVLTLPRGLRVAVVVLQASVALGGVLSLLGWVLDVQRYADWDGDGITIQPNTCVAAIVFGLGGACLAWSRRRFSAAAGALVALIGASTLFEHATRVGLGIDTLLMFDRTWGTVGVTAPGRMGLPAAFSWTVLGVALFLAVSAQRALSPARAWASGLALTTLAIASLSLIGYLYGAQALYTIPKLTAIANQTAMFLAAAALGLVLAIPERGPMRLFADAGPSGILARRLLPAVVVLPILIGAFRLAGFRAGLYDAEFGTALRTVFEIGLLLLFLWWSAGAIRAQDQRRREADEVRLERERALNEAQRLAQIGSWSWSAATGETVVSDELRRIYGLAPDRAFPTFAEQRGLFYSDETWRRIDAAFQNSMRTGESVQMDVEARRGSERIWVAIRFEAVVDASGAVIGTRGTVQDRSAHVLSDEERRKHEQLLRSVTEHAQVGLVIVDREHRYLYANPAFMAMVGRRDERIVGKLVGEVFGEAHAAQAATRLDHAFAGERARFEVRVPSPRPDEPARWVFATYEPQTDATGEVTSVVVALVDVTQAKANEAAREELYEREHLARTEAERAVRIKDEFLATLSHELRTPLNAVLGWSQILRQDSGDPEKTRTAAEVIERNARLQAQLITDLLDMSRIMSGKMRLEVQPVDLDDAVAAAVESMRPAAQAKSIRIECDAAPLGARIVGDPGRLQQVAWNLLSNAVKFTPRGGRVRVELARTPTHVEIRVSDTGEGIAPEFLPHMFERFRQADASTSRAHGGLGIGLALVKQLVELHGGRIHASSAGRGRGATFVVELPLDGVTHHDEPRTASAVATTSPEQARSSLSLNGKRVLVVDDEADALTVVGHLLQSCGADVVTAQSGAEALRLLDGATFDVVICDIGMPGMDGHALMRAVRARGVRTPALALSAFARAQDRTSSEAAGFQAHVSKPVDADELVRAVAGLSRTRG